ncbi:MAG: TAXI family TRAP transporter solute-binding subunit [Chloroflexi bacterium]|nr:TAXI family TRAP transporter solute-binding subunit [Chloroflexota bacterium]MBI4504184.1 TAXI family TRAP transporter solute-binding subunit [Chloroflexota bacterium]
MRSTIQSLAVAALMASTVSLAACGPPAQPAAPAKPAEPAKPAAAPAPVAAPAQPAAPAKPVEQAKPAQPAKPAAQPPKPEAKPAQPAKPAASGEPRKLLAGATSATSSHYAYYAAMAKVINSKVPSVNVTVVETGGGAENTNRMGKGELDFGIATSDFVSFAYQGLGPFKDKPIKEMRWLWFYNPNQHVLIVREDSGVKKLEDLTGKEFNPCARGAPCEQMSKSALEALDIKPKWYTAGLADAVQAIKDRRIVGYGKPMAGKDVADATMLDLMTTAKIRVLPFTEAQAKKVQDAHPYYSFTLVAPNVFKDQEWNKEPIRTMAIVVGTATTTRLPADIAYGIVKAVVEDNGAGGGGVQAGAFPGVKGIDFAKLTVEEDLLSAPPVHAGAYKYYKEIGKKVPDKLVPPEATR